MAPGVSCGEERRAQAKAWTPPAVECDYSPRVWSHPGSQRRCRRPPRAQRTGRSAPQPQKSPAAKRSSDSRRAGCWAWALKADSLRSRARCLTSAAARSSMEPSTTSGQSPCAPLSARAQDAPRVCARAVLLTPFPHVPCRYSCAWELPDSVRRKIVHSGLDLTKAFQHICADPDIGDKGGTAHNQSPSHRILPNVTSHPPEHGVDIINSL